MATIDVAVIGTTVESNATVSKAVTSNAVGNRAALVIAIGRISGGVGTHAWTCTYGGAPMSSVGEGNIALSGGVVWYSVFFLANPLTGLQTVTAIDTTASLGTRNIAVFVATGASQAGASVVATNLQNVGTETSGIITPTTPGSKDIVCDMMCSSSSGAGWTLNAGMSANQIEAGQDNTGVAADLVADYRPGSGGNMTHTVTAGRVGSVAVNFLDGSYVPRHGFVNHNNPGVL